MRSADHTAIFSAAIVYSILAIVVTNSLFLFQQRHRTRLDIVTVRHLVKIGTAVTNITLALFPLTAEAVELLRASQAFASSNCTVTRLAITYQMFFCPFVFSLALMLLTLELVVGRRTPALAKLFNQSAMANLVCAALPWLAGMVLVLPVALGGVDDWNDGCFYKSVTFFPVLYMLYTILPPLACLVICSVLLCVVGKTAMRAEEDAHTPIIAVSSSLNQLPEPSASSGLPPETWEDSERSSGPPRGQSLGLPTPPPIYPSPFKTGSGSSPEALAPFPAAAVSGLPPSEETALPQSPDDSVEMLTFRFRMEKRQLWLSAVLLFLGVVPCPAYILGLYFTRDQVLWDTDVRKVMAVAFFVVFQLPSIFLPLIWLPHAKF